MSRRSRVEPHLDDGARRRGDLDGGHVIITAPRSSRASFVSPVSSSQHAAEGAEVMLGEGDGGLSAQRAAGPVGGITRRPRSLPATDADARGYDTGTGFGIVNVPAALSHRTPVEDPLAERLEERAQRSRSSTVIARPRAPHRHLADALRDIVAGLKECLTGRPRTPRAVSAADVLRVAELALAALDHTGAILVPALVVTRGAGAVRVGVGEGCPDLRDGLAVVATPRLVLAQRLDVADRLAALIGALVGPDSGEVGLRKGLEPGDDLLGVERVVARDRQIAHPGDGGPQEKRGDPGVSDLPIAGYDTVNAEEVVAKLKTLSQTDLARVGAYERANQSRQTIRERIESLREDEPWRGYDGQTVAEIRTALADADADRARAARDYERRHKDRAGVIQSSERELSDA